MALLKKYLVKVFGSENFRKASRVKESLFSGFMRQSYSQEGEDLILLRFFENKIKGFYIDVGAYHPKRFSNTYVFYKKGWNGVNIDARPKSMKLFNRLRPRDINIECGIGKEFGTLTYYEFDEPALNGFSDNLSLDRDTNTEYEIVRKTPVDVYPLDYILDSNLKDSQEIDFMSIDVEGFDLMVLESNNWQKYRPKLILIESLNNGSDDEIGNFLSGKGYAFFAKTINTYFYKDMSCKS